MTRLRRLSAKRSQRDQDQVFVAEGAKVVEAALDADAAIEAIYCDTGATGIAALEPLIERARARGVRVHGLEPGVIERVSDTVTPQPILAVAHFVDRALETITSGVVIVLVDVRDPGNIGAVLRSADAAGIDAVIMSDGCADLYNPKTVRASAGSLFHLPVVRGGTPDAVLSHLEACGFVTCATLARSANDYADARLFPPLALVFGNEARGLDADIADRCAESISVPIAGGAESLNVAMAATVIAFELARRRRHDGRDALSMNA